MATADDAWPRQVMYHKIVADALWGHSLPAWRLSFPWMQQDREDDDDPDIKTAYLEKNIFGMGIVVCLGRLEVTTAGFQALDVGCYSAA